MTTTNSQFVFEDRYPFLDLTRSTEREFSHDLTQKCYEVFRQDFNTMQDHYRQARISQNLTQNLTQKLEEDIRELKVQAARLKGLLAEYDDFKTRTTRS